MTSARFRVVRAGPLVTLQDGGRRGKLRFGVPASGPMDPLAHAAANVLVGNDRDATAIEVSLAGFEVECVAGPVNVAVAGGRFSVEHAGEIHSSWVVLTVESGERLRIGAGRDGSWCVVAVAGRLDARSWLGSTATHSRAGIGGGALSADDELVVHDATVEPWLAGPVAAPPGSDAPSELRVVLGPQLDRFEPGAGDVLLGGAYTFSDAYDRMGVRLDGPLLPLGDALSIPSSPIVRGSIQVDGTGAPTLLLADHQTTGGYPKIATVIGPDAVAASRLRAGDTVRFRAVDASEAVRAARSSAERDAAFLRSLAERPAARTTTLLAHDLIGDPDVG